MSIAFRGLMERFQEPTAMRAWSRKASAQGLRVGFVPTMGQLHEGHLSLVREARRRADRVVVSVYVNPTQFAPDEDFDVYPRDPEGDGEKLRAEGCDVLFEPENLYSEGHDVWVHAETLERPLCGVSRPQFFRGVTTVINKLFHIVEPDLAVFGKKDYQQWRIISRMVEDLNFPIEIVGMPVVREEDGLAMSSRNVRMSPEARARAPEIYRSLCAAQATVARGARATFELLHDCTIQIQATGAEVDYVEIVDAHTLHPVDTIRGPVVLAVAARLDGVRLIDNIILEL